LLHLQLPLQLSTFSLVLYISHHSHFALSRMPINRQVWWLLFFNNSRCTWVDTFVNGRCNYHWQMVTLLLRVGCLIMANPNNHPLWHLYGQLCSCFFSTNLYLAALPSFHYESVFNTTSPFERINHARSGMIFQALHQGLQHPLKWKLPFPSATVIIWVSQYDHELTTLPRVYSSRSCACPLFHPRKPRLTSPWVSRS
jgi:hypothetical protein